MTYYTYPRSRYRRQKLSLFYKAYLIVFFIISFLVLFLNYTRGQNYQNFNQSNIVIDKAIQPKESDIILGDRKEWDNPRGRDALRRMKRLDDKGGFDINSLIEAKRQNDIKLMLKNAGINNWQWLGPGNIGGRTRSICIKPSNPNIIWIGSASGGIWKTTDGGESWEAMTDFIASLAISSIVIDPNNQNILYAGTGEGFSNYDALPGAGIFKSTDGGVTWTQLSSTKTWKYVNRLAHHPTQSNIIYGVGYDGAGYYGSVWKSTDGGSTWEDIYQTPTADLVTDISICKTNPSKILIGCYRDAYVSSDAGTSWTAINTGASGKLPTTAGRCEVAIAPSNCNIMYISYDRNNGEVWKSTDGGNNWSLMSNPKYLAQGWFANCIAVCPTDPNFVLIGGLDIWKSTDGGSNFSKITLWTYSFQTPFSPHADHHALVFSPVYNGTTDKRFWNGNDGGIAMTNDISGVQQLSGWVNMNNGLGITQFYSGAASPDGSIILGGTQDNGTLRLSSWQGVNYWTNVLGGDGGYCSVNYLNSDIVYSEFQYLSVAKSTNGGNTWYSCNSGLTDAGGSALFIAPFVMDPNNPNVLYAGGTSIWKTTNEAASWTKVRATTTNTPYCSAIEVAKGNSNIVWIGYNNGEVSKSTNGGSSWTVLTLPAKRYVTDIAVAPDNNNKVVVTMGGYVSNHIYCTTDGGSTWTAMNGTYPNNIPNIQINTVIFNQNNTEWLYVGTDLGVYSSEDFGKNWHLSGQSNSIANVEVDELFWQGDNLVAATHGRGMYKCYMPLFPSNPMVRLNNIIYESIKISLPLTSPGDVNTYIKGGIDQITQPAVPYLINKNTIISNEDLSNPAIIK